MYKLIYQTYLVPEKLSHADLLYRLYILPASAADHHHSIHPSVGNTLQRNGFLA